MGVFDAKLFNGEVFQGYIDRIPNVQKTELIKSKAIRPRPDLAMAMADNEGGNYITTPLKGLISGSAPQNYDGETNLVGSSTETFKHSRVVIGRAKAWTEKDFSYDITGGQDFLENIAEQIADYWNEIDQATIIHILNGVFNMSDDAGVEFVSSHTHDITAKTNSEGVLGKMDGTSLNSGMQKACGDNKSKFTLAIMHSVVATNLENLKLLAYMKYTDAQNIERELALATLNGRLVLIDDSMPVVETITTQGVKGVYTLTVGTAATAGDKIDIDGTEYTFGATTSFADKTLAVGSNATDQALAIKTVLQSQYGSKFLITQAAGVVTLKQTIAGTGAAPVIDVTQGASGTLAATVATTTTGVAEVKTTTYTTYVLGDGAIEYTDCGAKVPYEVDRDPSTNGGQDTLFSRQRKCFAPYGISFTQASMSKLSPTDVELELGTNWELVSTKKGSDEHHINGKAIPIARIISLG